MSGTAGARAASRSPSPARGTRTIGASGEASSRPSSADTRPMRSAVAARPDHDGERPRLAPFAAAQLGDGRAVARVAQQLEAAEPFERDDQAGADGARGLPERVVVRGQDFPRRIP